MGLISIVPTYEDGDILYEADLDGLFSPVTTLINVDKLDPTNFAIQSITASTKFAANSITTEKIVNDSIETNVIANNSITQAKIAAGSITAAKIAASAVTSSKLDSGVITRNKLYEIDSEIGEMGLNFTNAVASYTTALSVTLTVTGNNPIIISLQNSSYTGKAYGAHASKYRILRNSASVLVEGTLSGYQSSLAQVYWGIPGIMYFGTETAGTHTYEFQCYGNIEQVSSTYSLHVVEI